MAHQQNCGCTQNLENGADTELLNTAVKTRQTKCQLVEYLSQHTTRQTDCKQTNVREYVRQQTRYIIIGIPQTRQNTHNRVLAVEEQHKCQTDGHRNIERHRRGGEEGDHPLLVQHRQSRSQHARQQHDEPTEQRHCALESE